MIPGTLNPQSRPHVGSSSHPRIPPPRPLPPPEADQATYIQIDGHNSDCPHIQSLRPLVEADHTGRQSKYSLLPPVLVPHRSTPVALSCTWVNATGRRSVSPPVPLPDNAIPPRHSLLPPPRRTSPLATAVVADNQQTPRYSLLPHMHVALSPGVAQSASPMSITRPAITNFRMLGSAEPSLCEEPTFMSSVHALRNASPSFFYLTCEFKPHYARCVLVHAYC